MEQVSACTIRGILSACLSLGKILVTTKAIHKQMISTRAACKMLKSVLMMLLVITVDLCAGVRWHWMTPRRRLSYWNLAISNANNFPKKKDVVYPERPIRCYFQPDQRICEHALSYQRIWYYNWDSNDCLQFSWGSCGGLPVWTEFNRFKTREQCLAFCQY